MSSRALCEREDHAVQAQRLPVDRHAKNPRWPHPWGTLSMSQSRKSANAVVIGASGGIGRALVEALLADGVAAVQAVLHGSGVWAQCPPTPSESGDADVLRASQLQHAVEHVDGDLHLGGPALVRMRAQPVPDHPFPPPDGGLGPGTPVVA